MSNRPYGHYHVMHGAFEDWTVAERCEEGWLLPGINRVLREEEFEEISERIPTPDEPWQTVPSTLTPEWQGAMRERGVRTATIMATVEDALAAAPRPGGGDGHH